MASYGFKLLKLALFFFFMSFFFLHLLSYPNVLTDNFFLDMMPSPYPPFRLLCLGLLYPLAIAPNLVFRVVFPILQLHTRTCTIT